MIYACDIISSLNECSSDTEVSVLEVKYCKADKCYYDLLLLHCTNFLIYILCLGKWRCVYNEGQYFNVHIVLQTLWVNLHMKEKVHCLHCIMLLLSFCNFWFYFSWLFSINKGNKYFFLMLFLLAYVVYHQLIIFYYNTQSQSSWSQTFVSQILFSKKFFNCIGSLWNLFFVQRNADRLHPVKKSTT